MKLNFAPRVSAAIRLVRSKARPASARLHTRRKVAPTKTGTPMKIGRRLGTKRTKGGLGSSDLMYRKRGGMHLKEVILVVRPLKCVSCQCVGHEMTTDGQNLCR